MKRIAFIDLGSNSVRFVVSEIDSNGSYKLIYQQKESIRLSEGMWAENTLTEVAISRALRTLRGFGQMSQAMEVTRTIAVATAAVRLAKNGPSFLKRVKKETGISIKCISGEEEARLGFLGVVNTMDVNDFILFDLGGASIEVTLVKNRIIQKSFSFPMGALTVTGRFRSSNDLSTDEFNSMNEYIQTTFSTKKWLKNIKLPIIGIGGTIRTLGKMDQRKINYPISKLHNYELPLNRLHDMYKDIAAKSLTQRRKLPGLSADRADIIVAGLAIISNLVNYTKGIELRVSGCGLREGLFYDYYGENFAKGNVLIENILYESAENFLRLLPNEQPDHAYYVANLTDSLFRQWAPLHNLPLRWGRLLHVSALLHDSGKVINYYSHARHSAYMILNTNLYGLTHREQAFCAFAAAYSHGTSGKIPKNFRSSLFLSGEDWVAVRKASLILALAEAIDENHQQSVIFTETIIETTKVRLILHIKPGTKTDFFTVLVEKLQRQFKKDYGKILVISWEESSVGEQ